MAASDTISTPRRNSKSEKQKKTENQQLRILNHSPNHNRYDHKRNPYRCTSACLCFAVSRPAPSARCAARRACHGTRATPAPRCSPPPPVLPRPLWQRTRRRLQPTGLPRRSGCSTRPGSPIVGNLEELAGDVELVIGVKQHPRHVDVAQFGCDQVLYCVHVFFVVVSPRGSLRASCAGRSR